MGATWLDGSVQVAVNVELPACGVATSSVGGGGGLLSTVIRSESTVDWLPAASVAVSVSVCVPSGRFVVGSVKV